MDKRKDKSEECGKCGKMFSPAGFAHHTKFCNGADYKPGHTHSVPGRHDKKSNRVKILPNTLTCKYCRSAIGRQGLGPHEKFCRSRPDHAVVIQRHRQLFRRGKIQEDLPLDMEKAYELCGDDAALFGAVNHILIAKSGTDVLANLKAAKTFIDLKIKALGG